MNTKKVAFHTLGCKLNFSETSTIATSFYEKGYEQVKFGEKADIILLNTCSVTQSAEKKCKQAIKKAKDKSPGAFIAVTGCFAQLQAEELSRIPGVDIVLGAKDKFKIFDYITDNKQESNIHSCEISEVTEFEAAFSQGDRTRSFMKVQDGCNYACTYCTIPKARGISRNGTIKSMVENAEKIALTGVKEIILTGVNIGDFGRSTEESFFDLIQELDKVEGIARYRISSIEPNLLTDELIRFCSESNKFLPHYHIPLQSGSNKILALMKRRYNRELFESKIVKIKSITPEAFIGIDVIVGFPGETEDEFLETYNFIDSLDISFIHVFSYSDRPGTVSINLEKKVTAQEIKSRSVRLHELSSKKHLEFYLKNIHANHVVLYESSKKGDYMFGFTGNYIKVRTLYDKSLVNKLTPITISEIIQTPELLAISLH